MADARSVLHAKKVAFIDLDGTIYLGNSLIPGAGEFLQFLEEEGILYYFLSNNSSRSKAEYVEKLAALGVPADKEKILLSTDGVIAHLFDQDVRDLYVVGTKSMVDVFLEAGFRVASPSPHYVVIGFDTELTYDKIKTAALHMQKGVELIATHPDVVCPTAEGFIPDAGALCALLEKATGKKPFKVFGKPNPEMVTHLMKKHDVSPDDVVIIGDRIYTDMELAKRIGCDSVLVLSGETKKKDLLSLELRPTLVVDSVADLVQRDKG